MEIIVAISGMRMIMKKILTIVIMQYFICIVCFGTFSKAGRFVYLFGDSKDCSGKHNVLA
jgi:hypothetical protein